MQVRLLTLLSIPPFQLVWLHLRGSDQQGARDGKSVEHPCSQALPAMAPACEARNVRLVAEPERHKQPSIRSYQKSQRRIQA